MKARRRNIVQITLMFFGILLILLTYFLYPILNKKKTISEQIFITEENKTDDVQGDYFENIEYNALYRDDNKFKINSKKAYISKEEPDIVHMVNMRVNIEMVDGRIIVITSDKGIYDKKTYDCYFQDNVQATDGETILLAKNIDLLASEDNATIYNNVVLTSNNGSVFADRIDYDFKTKYYKVSMFDNERIKVKLIQ